MKNELFFSIKKFSSFLFFFSFLGISLTYAQTTVRGKVTDEKGELVVGATLILKSKPTFGTTTDFDGNYSIKISEPLPQTLVISYISYKTIEVEITAASGPTVVKNISLVSESQALNEVEITAKASRQSEAYIEKMKMNSATTIDYISTETIKKTGDSYVSNALARVSGVTTTSTGLVSVRGIGDRYVKTTLNNAIIPTLDPFTNNLKLDIFPTTLIDNVIVSKTAQADFQSDWAGAYISVMTKDFPESLILTAETSIGYNTQSTFQEIISGKTSTTDWLGYDNGYRDYDHEKYIPVNTGPSQYDEMVALGLGPYYASMGVTTSWDAGSYNGEAYFRLGLVQLGLLGASQVNDPVAVTNAKNQYIEGGYKNNAFGLMNAQGGESVNELQNNWSTSYKTAPLDFSQSVVIGNQVDVFGRPLGFIVGGRYASQYRYDPNGVSNRLNSQNQINASRYEEVGLVSNGWSGLFNINYKIAKNNSIGFLFMPNQTGVNKVRDAIDYDDYPGYEAALSKDQFYEQRKQFIYQFKSENYIPSLKTKIDLNASYTDGESEAPDFKRLTYFELEPGVYIIDRKEATIERYFRFLDENIFDSQLSVEFPLSSKPGLSRKLRLGGAYTKNDRESQQYAYRVNLQDGASPVIINNDLDAFFANENFQLNQDSAGNYYFDKAYSRDENYANNIFGYRQVIGAFLMTDYNLTFALRLTGGVRVENAIIFTDVVEYDRLGYEVNDPRRKYGDDIFLVNPGKLNETSVLPSVGLIYNFRSDSDFPMNLRVNYSKSVARPSIREMSETIVYDYELKDDLFGNANLKTVKIDNYDVRLERYFKSGANISGSLFYKNFIDHIELINTVQGFTWQNVDKSFIYGIELEGGIKLFKHLDVQANITFVKSQTEFIEQNLVNVNGIKEYYPVDTVKRSMYGQAPFVINTIIGYDFDSLGLSLALSYNLQGEKLVITSLGSNPDVYEMPRHLVDFKVSKKLGNYFSTSLKVQNIFNQPIRRSYLFDDDSTIDYDQYRYGATFTLGLTYKLTR